MNKQPAELPSKKEPVVPATGSYVDRYLAAYPLLKQDRDYHRSKSESILTVVAPILVFFVIPLLAEGLAAWVRGW